MARKWVRKGRHPMVIFRPDDSIANADWPKETDDTIWAKKLPRDPDSKRARDAINRRRKETGQGPPPDPETPSD